MPFKNLSSTEETKTALREWAKRIESAKSIVVAGAGATGVEIAGELGQEYAVPGKKQITLVCDDDLPLSAHLRRDVRETTKDELERLKVKVITNARLATAPSAAPKTSTLTLTLTKTSASSADEAPTTLQADLLIPTYGITPNTAFLPPSLLDSRGHVRQTARLRAEGYDNIFVAGDAGNLESHQAVHADSQAVHIARLLEARILGGVPGSPSLKPDEEEEDYKPIDKVMFAVTLGRNRGTGQVGSWKLWSLLVWFMKGRYLGTNYAPEYARGERTLRLKSW